MVIADIRPNIGLGNAVCGSAICRNAIIQSMRYAQEIRYPFKALFMWGSYQQMAPHSNSSLLKL